MIDLLGLLWPSGIRYGVFVDPLAVDSQEPVDGPKQDPLPFFDYG